MPRVVVKKQVAAPIQQVWESWDDFGNIYKFNPNLRHSRLLSESGKPTGIGSERQCDMADNKNWIRERIVEYKPPYLVKIDIFDGTLPMKSMQAMFNFQEQSRDVTQVRMTVDFEPRFGVLGQLMAPLMKRQFRPMLQALLDCNAAHVERGEVVPRAA